MAPNPLSSATLVALALAGLLILLLVAFLFLFLRLKFPPISPPSRSILSINALEPQTGAMEPVFAPTSNKAEGPDVPNLLDLSSPEEFHFPTLQPQLPPTPAARALAPDPVIREVHERPRGRRRPARSPRRYRRRSIGCSKRLIGSQGSPIDLASEGGKPSGKNGKNGEDHPAIAVNRPGTVRQPFRIHWALGDASVFNSREEELAAARNAYYILDSGLRNDTLFQWGLRYIPPSHAENIYRTVTIEKLSPRVSLDQILPRIRGGQIYSASLCDTFSITKSWTALIVFVHQAGASAFRRRVAQEGFYVGFNAVSVRQVPTPTYLLNSLMIQEIALRGRTRCLKISSPNPRLKVILHGILTQACLHRQVECFGEKDVEGMSTIRFHSIKAAMRAYNALADNKTLNVSVQFDTDPCSV